MQELTPIRYSTKLLFGKFMYQVQLELISNINGRLNQVDRNIILHPIKQWLGKNCLGAYKTTASWDTYGTPGMVSLKDICKLRVYLENSTDYMAFKHNHADTIKSCCHPASKQHEEMIRNGLNIDIRDDLYYNKYRYKIHFRFWWSSENRKKMISQLKSLIHDDSKKKQEYFFSRYGGNVYLSNRSDLMMIRMSMPEQIVSICVVSTHGEING